MKKIFLFVLCTGLLYSEDNTTSQGKIYVGFSAGLVSQSVGYTDYFLGWGVRALHATENQYVRLSYYRNYAFSFGDPSDNSSVHRVELVYGCITNISNTYKFFRLCYFG